MNLAVESLHSADQHSKPTELNRFVQCEPLYLSFIQAVVLTWPGGVPFILILNCCPGEILLTFYIFKSTHSYNHLSWTTSSWTRRSKMSFKNYSRKSKFLKYLSVFCKNIWGDRRQNSGLKRNRVFFLKPLFCWIFSYNLLILLKTNAKSRFTKKW